MRRSIGIAAMTAAVLVSGGMSATARADGTGAAEPSASSSPRTAPDWAGRLDHACRRVDRSLARAQKLQARLGADDRSKGSLAFLKRRIDAAERAGQDDLATVLGLRLQLRQQIADQLPERVDLLEQANQACEKAGE